MKAGNFNYIKASDLPETLAVFPLESVMVLPGGYLPLTIFEPRYLQMVEDAMRTNQLIGIIQPLPEQNITKPELYKTGCMARIVSFTETGDGRLLISLQGICRFHCDKEIVNDTPYRIFAISPFLDDLSEKENSNMIDREALLNAFADYLDANDLEADWESVMQASSETLVNALAISAPFGPAEKQALLESPDINIRAETLIALAERSLLTQDGIDSRDLQ